MTEKDPKKAAVREPLSLPPPLFSVDSLDQIRAAQSGDPIALGNVLDSLSPWVGRLCGSIALDAGPDAAQETLIQVMRDLRGLRDPASFRSWVRRIATREAIRHAERRRRDPLVEYADSTPARSLDPGLQGDVSRVLDTLPPDHRAILILRDLEGLSESEAAEELNLTQGTIKSRLHRARQAFRQGWKS